MAPGRIFSMKKLSRRTISSPVSRSQAFGSSRTGSILLGILQTLEAWNCHWWAAGTMIGIRFFRDGACSPTTHKLLLISEWLRGWASRRVTVGWLGEPGWDYGPSRGNTGSF